MRDNDINSHLHRFWTSDCPMHDISVGPEVQDSTILPNFETTPDSVASRCIMREPSVLYVGGILTKPFGAAQQGQKLTSSNGSYVLVHQNDGNVVLYTVDGTPLWWTGTSSSEVLVMQGDGNLVLYGSPGPWNSQTYGHPGAMLKVADDGDLAIVDSAEAVISYLFRSPY